MGIFELTILRLFVAAFLVRVARWLHAPYPVDAGAGRHRGGARSRDATTLDPALALALFVAPTLARCRL